MRVIDATILIVGLIGVAVWVVASGKDGFKGNNAMIVARIVSIAATVQGCVDNVLPVVGSKFSSGDLLVRVQGSRVDRTRLAEFESQIAYRESEITGASAQNAPLWASRPQGC